MENRAIMMISRADKTENKNRRKWIRRADCARRLPNAMPENNPKRHAVNFDAESKEGESV